MNAVDTTVDIGGQNGHHAQEQQDQKQQRPLACGTATTNSANQTADSVPVFVMLPLDTVNADGVFKYAASRWFLAALQQLKESGIHGVAVDVWVR